MRNQKRRREVKDLLNAIDDRACHQWLRALLTYGEAVNLNQPPDADEAPTKTRNRRKSRPRTPCY
jgi:hypothetical protein